MTIGNFYDIVKSQTNNEFRNEIFFLLPSGMLSIFNHLFYFLDDIQLRFNELELGELSNTYTWLYVLPNLTDLQVERNYAKA